MRRLDAPILASLRRAPCHVALGVGVTLLASPLSGQQCLPSGSDVARVRALPAAKFEVNDAEREALALAFIGCLGSRDPVLRDDVAFTGLSTWMRGKRLSPPVIATIGERTLALLRTSRDTAVFTQSFAMLVLSEVVRADRVDSLLPPDLLRAIAVEGERHLAGIRDYRGYDPVEGWRHDMAHSADVLLQLAMNPRVPTPVIERWLSSLAVHVDGRGEHLYLEGEPDRMVRALNVVARRGLIPVSVWQHWLASVVAPGSLGSWERAVESTAGRIRRQNLLMFLYTLDFALRDGPFEGAVPLQDLVQRALRTVLGG
jgi:hypothetical protein